MKRFATMAAAAAIAMTTSAHAGGQLDTFDIEDPLGGGFFVANIVPIRWDDRCKSISYTHNETPANVGTIAEIPVATLVSEQQTSFDQWNQIPTSTIEMNITGTADLGQDVRGFDFVNELTWITPPGSGFLASSPSVSLIDETTFMPGDQIDGDGDSDVFDPAIEGRDTCFDYDNDGDIDFPAGTYPAGTILDNDVQYNDLFVWVTSPNDAGTVDIQAVAVHEFGHSHGLSHSMINQISIADGTGSTMFPFIDTTDAASEAGQRDLHIDDIAWSSFVYPTPGNGYLYFRQPAGGDIPFEKKFDVIRGTVTQNGLGVLGASVQAITSHGLYGERVGEGYSGFGRLVFNPSTGAIFVFNDPSAAILDGEYEIPVPKGHYDLNIEALDGSPAGANNISTTAILGSVYGQNSFAEEFLSFRFFESDNEERPGDSVPVSSSPYSHSSKDFITNNDVLLRNAPSVDFIGSGFVGSQDNVIYAERFDRDDVLAVLNAGGVLTTALYHTATTDASFVPFFKRVALVTGTVSGDGLTATIDLHNDIARNNEHWFVGQDNDLTPQYFFAPRFFSRKVKRELRRNPGKDLFLIVEVDDNQIGPTGLDPLIAIDAPTGAPGDVFTPTFQSFLSINGGPFGVQTNRNWAMELRFTP